MPADVKPIPVTLPGDQDKMVAEYRKITYLFDEMFRVPGTKWRFGLDSIVGLVPGVGDIAVGSIGAYALYLAFRLKAPAAILARMLWNVAIDTIVGSVPFLGDFFDATWKANTKNRLLLEKWLADPARTTRRSKLTLIFFAVLFVLIIAGSLWLSWVVLQLMISLLRT